ncbi:MAG TPA: hypothetical protein PKJ41_01605 [Bryobacteraceae bacterium]|nr:hypothetical protein [Bryobacteraceae bacterium]
MAETIQPETTGIRTAPHAGLTAAGAVREIITHPGRLLLRRWNWKAALFSSLLRSLVYFAANLAAGSAAAASAMTDEFLYRAATAGFYGAITQQMSRARPVWAGTLASLLLPPFAAHGGEIVIHLWRGVPHFGRSLAASVCFTVLATLFNLHAMRRGALLVGAGNQGFLADMRAVPGLLLSFVAAPLRLLLLLASCARRWARAQLEHS